MRYVAEKHDKRLSAAVFSVNVALIYTTWRCRGSGRRCLPEIIFSRYLRRQSRRR
jgi:hypothetical protein